MFSWLIVITTIPWKAIPTHVHNYNGKLMTTNVDDETKQLNKEREEQMRGVVSKLTTPCLQGIEEALKQGRYGSDTTHLVPRVPLEEWYRYH